MIWSIIKKWKINFQISKSLTSNAYQNRMLKLAMINLQRLLFLKKSSNTKMMICLFTCHSCKKLVHSLEVCRVKRLYVLLFAFQGNAIINDVSTNWWLFNLLVICFLNGDFSSTLTFVLGNCVLYTSTLTHSSFSKSKI